MGTSNCYDGIDQYAVQLIKRKAKQLIGKAGFRGYDLQDLEQELMMDLLQRLPKYDNERAQNKTFIDRIVKHKIRDLIEVQKAEMRDYRHCLFSLNELLESEDDEVIERIETFDQEEYLHRTGRLSLRSDKVRDLSIDLKRVINGLAPELRTLCKRLMADTITEISNQTRISRGTIYELIKKLQKIMEEADLKKYL